MTPLLIILMKLIFSIVINISDYAYTFDPNVSFYGPGFYGHRTACGYALTAPSKKLHRSGLIGVAHRWLPCGTQVTFIYKNTVVTMPVVDRGPYVRGRQWDLTGGACVVLNHCFTGGIYYRIEK